MKDCTIILQGRINRECLNLYIKNYSTSNIILSVWNDEEISSSEIPKNWKLIFNDYPKKRFATPGNLDLQILSTLSGLIQTNTEFVIKARGDEYWSNLDLVYNKIINNKSKIVTSSMFFRKPELYEFHCGDKIIAGTKENLQLMFNTAYNLAKEQVLETNVPEIHLGLGYLIGKNEIICDETFILLFNNKHRKFDKEGAKFGMKKAIEKINKDFDLILSKNDVDLQMANAIINNCKNILTYCYGYNELTEKFQDKIDYNAWELMKSNFDIIDVNLLKPYIATRNFGDAKGRIWYRDNFDNDSEDCISAI